MPRKSALLVAEALGQKVGPAFKPDRRPEFKPPRLRWFTTVNFDDLPSGTSISANQYAGATLSTLAPSGRPVYAVAWPNTAKSPPNTVTLTAPDVLPAFDARDGAIEARFNTLQMTVAIDALPLVTPETLGLPVTNQPFLEAYGENNQYLGKVLYPLAHGSPGYGSWQTLTFSSATANIRSVRFSSQHHGAPAVYAMFDNLYFQLSFWDLAGSR